MSVASIWHKGGGQQNNEKRYSGLNNQNRVLGGGYLIVYSGIQRNGIGKGFKSLMGTVALASKTACGLLHEDPL